MSGLGVSSPVSRMPIPALEITMNEDYYWLMGPRSYRRGATNKELESYTDSVFESFGRLRDKVVKSKGLTLTPEQCRAELVALAEWGLQAYNRLFADGDGRSRLSNLFRIYGELTPAPTFISDAVPFPWEVLYDGDYLQGDPGSFWGFRYPVARNLQIERDTTLDVVQDIAADMLFCLYNKLEHARDREHHDVKELVMRAERRDRFYLLGHACGLTELKEGERPGPALLRYLVSTHVTHNMLHFACHCRKASNGSDVLVLSLIDDSSNMRAPADELHLATTDFGLLNQAFPGRPLVFLNACDSGGGADELKRTFNLPAVFIKGGAAAMIATACPVPDVFAAAFSHRFYTYFLRGEELEDGPRRYYRPLPIGEALRRTRRYFLDEHRNPLGLAYGLYSPAHYRLAEAPAQGAARG